MTGVFGKDFQIFFLDHDGVRSKKKILQEEVSENKKSSNEEAVWYKIDSCFLSLFQQRDCIQFALTAKPAQRYMPADHKSLQYKIWILVMSKPFDTFILVLIALNTGVLMTQVAAWAHPPPPLLPHTPYLESWDCPWAEILQHPLQRREAILQHLIQGKRGGGGVCRNTPASPPGEGSNTPAANPGEGEGEVVRRNIPASPPHLGGSSNATKSHPGGGEATLLVPSFRVINAGLMGH